MPPRNINLILLAAIISLFCHVAYRDARTASVIGEAIELIDQNYVDPVDRKTLVSAAMQGVVEQLDDHSSYFAIEEYSNFQDSISQEFAGIGIYVEQPEVGQPVRIVTPLVGSPALKAGLLPGDLIVVVDGEDVSQMALSDVSSRLKGPPGTQVRLKVVREVEKELAVTVTRARIELESVVGDHRDSKNKWVYRLKSQPRIAYLRLKSFGEKTVRELEDILRRLDNEFDALVLDLRGNGGGLLYAARDVCDMFLSAGDIVSTRTRGGVIEESHSATPGTLVDPQIPVAVLIDGNSASASEIVAACLQDNGRAVIVGTRSFGKGTVQEVIPLQYSRSALRLTVARYYRPNNENIHRKSDATEDDEWGVRPDQGFNVPMDMPSLIALDRVWQKASFPLLATEKSDTVPPDQMSADAEDSAIEPADEPGISGADSTDEAQEPVSISVEAEANVQKGPKSLEIDPPLRAAVGRLLQEIRDRISTSLPHAA